MEIERKDAGMRIEISTLHEICQRLFQYMEEQGIEFVDVPADYYWNIPLDQVYNPYQKPNNLDLGQLTDDWNELQKLLRNEREPIGYFWVWFAAISRAVGENSPL